MNGGLTVDVEVVEGTGIKKPKHEGVKVNKQRVAAYCRVSTDLEEQLYSYQSQMSYYKEYISSKPEWDFVGIYADEGITGTMTSKRDGFLKMINDCMSGKIDLIITKSISRFARNTLLNFPTPNFPVIPVHICFERQASLPVDFSRISCSRQRAQPESC